MFPLAPFGEWATQPAGERAEEIAGGLLASVTSGAVNCEFASTGENLGESSDVRVGNRWHEDAVRMEIRVAEITAANESGGAPAMSDDECAGWDMNELGTGTSPDTDGELAGWLASVVAFHDEEQASTEGVVEPQRHVVEQEGDNG